MYTVPFETKVHGGAPNAGANADDGAWVPYVPRDLEARTIVRFQIIMPKALVRTDLGEVVCVSGSCAALRGHRGRAFLPDAAAEEEWRVGLPLQQADDDPSVWTGRAVLPYSDLEYRTGPAVGRRGRVVCCTARPCGAGVV